MPGKLMLGYTTGSANVWLFPMLRVHPGPSRALIRFESTGSFDHGVKLWYCCSPFTNTG